jgi:transcriptional regulator with XRE-family HTH domain
MKPLKIGQIANNIRIWILIPSQPTVLRERVIMAINENLQTLLRELNISQRQFAMTLHLDPGYFSRIIQGKAPLVARLQLLIENTYNVNGEWLRTGNGPMFKSGSDSSARQRIVLALNDLDAEQLSLVEAYVRRLQKKKDSGKTEE